MTKRKKRGLEIPHSAEVFGNTPIHPLAATGAESEGIPGTSLSTFGHDATNIPSLRSTDEEPSQPSAYVNTPSALADKHLLSKEPGFILLIVVVVGIVGIAGIDNYQGRLTHKADLVFLVWKCVTIFALVGAAAILYALYNKARRWFG